MNPQTIVIHRYSTIAAERSCGVVKTEVLVTVLYLTVSDCISVLHLAVLIGSVINYSLSFVPLCVIRFSSDKIFFLQYFFSFQSILLLFFNHN